MNFMKEIFLDCFMAFGPSINYLFQVLKFKKTKSSKGFSPYLCLITIISHTLKIFFWFTEKFKYTLLIQSILVIITQLYLIYLCVKYQDHQIDYEKGPLDIKNNNDNSNNKYLIKDIMCDWKQTFNLKYIWKWNNIVEYYKFYSSIIALLILFYIYCNSNYYSMIIGTASVCLEMMCSLPQIIEMYRTKNQRNISKLMVLMWLFGNALKVYYNIYNHCPIQLIIGAYIQVFFNIILISQIIYYYFNDKNELITNDDTIKSNKILFDTSPNEEDNKI